MKTLLESIEDIDQIIRDLHKVDSKLQSGQIIAAYRDINRMISFFEQAKKNILLGQQEVNNNVTKAVTDILNPKPKSNLSLSEQCVKEITDIEDKLIFDKLNNK